MSFLKFFRHFSVHATWQIVPFLSAVAAEIFQLRRIHTSESKGELLWDDASMALAVDDLEKSHQLELGRRTRLEDKAQANLRTAALAASFGLGFIALLAKAAIGAPPPQYTAASAVVAVLACVNLASSALSAGKACGVTRIHDLFLIERLQTSKYMRESHEQNRKAQLISMIRLNEAFTLIASAYATASGIALRNGVILLAAVIALQIVLWCGLLPVGGS